MQKTLCVAILLCLAFAASAAPKPGERTIDVPAIHPHAREVAAPSGGEEAALNPPPLLWPATKGATYAVQISSDPTFPKGKTTSVAGVRAAFHNLHRRLAPGTWHWRYAVVQKGKSDWSKTCSFKITADTMVFETKTPEEMLKAVPASHPRLLVIEGGMDAFRERAAKDSGAQQIVRGAKRLVGSELPDEASGKPTAEQAKAGKMKAKKFAKWAGKKLGGTMGGRCKTLARAYLMTGDEKYGREAIRQALHTASFSLKGPTSWGVSDFAHGSVTAGMAHVYDACYDLMKPEEKETLKKAIRARMIQMHRRWINNVETRVFSAHIWQHILHNYLDGAFATLGDIPEADEWASYVYGLWIARVPLMGGNDGGWANGGGYFGTNVITLVDIPHFFESLTGVDLYAHPWFRNSAYYIMYTWPPGQPRAQFGDGGQSDGHPMANRVAYVDVIGRHFNDPNVAWYVDKTMDGNWQKVAQAKRLRWHYLCHGIDAPIKNKAETFYLPQAHVMRDIGVATMHTNYAEPTDSLMVGFRSSPYGAFNHAHADQNGFTVNFAGQRIWTKSGYYIAYGDDHFKGWYTHSRGSNTILVDGQGQLKNTSGYGWIPRFLDGEKIAYCVGDASRAYPEEVGLERFRRHVLLLRPRTVVIYDELEAAKPVQYTWAAHAIEEIRGDAQAMRLETERGGTHSRIDLAASTPVRFNVHHKFDPPADNWRQKKSGKGEARAYADQWHAFIDTAKQQKNARFFAIIQTDKKEGAKIAFRDAKPAADGWIELDGWRVRAETDAGKAPALEAVAADGKAAFGYGVGAVKAAGKTFKRKADGASVLVDTVDGKIAQQEAVDVLPAAAR